MSNAAREDGSNVAHEKLSQQVVAEEAGYFYIYLSNDSNTGSEAFSRGKLGTSFDDFTIQTSESYIVQQIDYYPYGMVARDFKRLGEKHTNDLFQGKTYEDLTKWYDFHARQYDAALGRWFGVDPQDQFASPYVGMGNNPVMMVDPDGELAWFVPAIFAGVQLGVDLIRNDFKMDGKQIAMSLLKGGLQGTLAAIGPAGIATWQGALSSAVSSQLPAAQISIRGLTLGISPSFSLGSNNFNLGTNVFGSIQVGDFSVGTSLMTGYGSGFSGRANFEQRFSYGIGYSNGNFGLSLYQSQYGSIDGTSQSVGGIGISGKDWSLRYENDWPLGDGGDRFRTAALRGQYKDFSAGFNLFTGAPKEDASGGRITSQIKGVDYYEERGGTSEYRLGAAYIGYRNYHIGANSETVRHLIQNKIIHKTFGYAYFRVHEQYVKPRLYTRYSSYNPYSLW